MCAVSYSRTLFFFLCWTHVVQTRRAWSPSMWWWLTSSIHTHTHTPLLTSHPPGFLQAPPSLLCLHVHLQIISTHTHICTDKHKATACSEHVVIIWRHPVREVRTGLGTGPRERNLPSRPATGWFTELFRYLFTYLFMHTSMIDEAQNYSTTIWP